MFKKLFLILIFLFVGLLGVMLVAVGEELSEKILPLFFGLIVLLYISASWYAGYLIATQKPSPVLMIFGGAVLVVAFLSGYFIGGKG